MSANLFNNWTKTNKSWLPFTKELHESGNIIFVGHALWVVWLPQIAEIDLIRLSMELFRWERVTRFWQNFATLAKYSGSLVFFVVDLIFGIGLNLPTLANFLR